MRSIHHGRTGKFKVLYAIKSVFEKLGKQDISATMGIAMKLIWGSTINSCGKS
jgi:hypothetical protein